MRKAEEKKAADERAAAAADSKTDVGEDDSGVEVEYVQEKPLVDITNPLYSQFYKVFETFKVCYIWCSQFYKVFEPTLAPFL